MTEEFPYVKFEIDDRVRTCVSYHGDKRRVKANRVERHGVVTGKSKLYSNSYFVKWNHKPTSEAMHARYLVRE